MSRDIICLTEEQVLTNLNNLVEIMKLPKIVKVYDGKPKTQYKTASRYQLFESKDEFYFIVVYSDNFNIQYFQACEFFEKDFKDFVKEPDRPKIYICSAFTIPKTYYKLLPSNLIKYPFRFVKITDLHPIIGSKNLLPAHIKSYELLNTKEKAFNNKDFPVILDSDPVVKILNALPGELIRCHEIIVDNWKPYTQYKIRRVVSTKSSIKDLPNSGLANFD